MTGRFLLLLPLAAIALSCSSKADPVVSGGAQFRLQNPAAADKGTLGNCPDNQLFTVAQRGEDGQLKLVVDGADDARVSCQVDGGRFVISVSRAAATISGSGSIQGTTSTNADFTFLTGTGNRYRTTTKKCTVTITQNTEGRFRGKVKCPLVEHLELPNGCSTTDTAVPDPDGVDRSSTFFAFANCTGF